MPQHQGWKKPPRQNWNPTLGPKQVYAKQQDGGEEFQHTHYYDPMGWDQLDPRTHPGSQPIAPGSPIQNLGTFPGAPKVGRHTFHHVRDEAGNHQSVFRGSMKSKRQFESEQGGELSPDDPLGQRLQRMNNTFRDRRGG